MPSGVIRALALLAGLCAGAAGVGMAEIPILASASAEEAPWGDRAGSRPALSEARWEARLRRACRGGDPAGCVRLGAHLYGSAEDQAEEAEGARAFALGCAGGAPSGCAGLGLAYLAGWGVEEDFSGGMTLLRRSCEDGHAAGCAYLADVFAFATIVPLSVSEAERFYRMALELDPTSAHALNGLNRLDPR